MPEWFDAVDEWLDDDTGDISPPFAEIRKITDLARAYVSEFG